MVEKTDYTVAELIRELIEDDYAMGVTGNNSYLRKLETLKRIETKSIGKTKIEKATEKGIKDFLIAESRICSTSTLRKTYALLKRCFKEAEKRKYIVNSPLTMNCPKSRLPTVKVRALTLQEQKRLLNYLHNNKTKYGAQMEIMMLTGMRMGEINALKLSDIDLDGKRLFVNRTVTVDENNRPVLGETTKTYAGIREICLTPAVLTIVKKAYWNKLQTLKTYCSVTKNKDLFQLHKSTVHLCGLFKHERLLIRMFRGKCLYTHCGTHTQHDVLRAECLPKCFKKY